MISRIRSSVKSRAPLGWKRMGQPRGLLTPEERAMITELQDLRRVPLPEVVFGDQEGQPRRDVEQFGPTA